MLPLLHLALVLTRPLNNSFPAIAPVLQAACGVLQYITAMAFLWALAKHGDSSKGIRLAWAGLPSVRDLVPFMDVGWKLLTRTLFKMAAFASISAVATTLAQKSIASHQVRLGSVQSVGSLKPCSRSRQ